MSNAIKQILILGAVFAIILVFIIQFRPGTNVQTSGGPECIARVSGNCIAESDYLAAYRMSAPPNADRDDIKSMRLDRLIVEGLIERWLLNQDAERLGIAVSDDDINRQLVKGYVRISLPAAQADFLAARLGLLPEPVGPARVLRGVRNPENDKFDVKRYERRIRDVAAKTPKDFREFQRKEFIAARMRELIRSRVRVSPTEVRAAFERERKQAVVDYVKVERAWYRKHVIDTSEEAIAKWAESHGDDVDKSWESRKSSFLPECRVARHILVRVDPAAPDPDAAKQQAKEKLASAQERIAGDETFADVAADVSEDPGSKARGGDLGCVAKGQMVKPFEDALFAMTEEGKLSDLVESNFGFHLIQLDKIAKGEEAEKVGRAQVTRDLYAKLESERLAAEGAKQILAAVQGGKAMEQAVEAYLDGLLPAEARQAPAEGGDEGDEEDDDEQPETAMTDPSRPRVQPSLPFTISGPPFSGVQNPAGAAGTIFALEKPGAVPNDLIKLYDGYAVVRLKEKNAPTEEDWTKEQGRYLDQRRRAKQRDALIRYVQKLRERHGKEITYHKKLLEEPGEGKDEEGDG
ncbi:MAG: peptidylprolyl isomerase [Deltaproteobacteria bacterium]|jgi:peptidyl-prolyl cis-trans isomerase D|nr:peptidylprolyl isomerase [Deltaproteobacteria bacterium]MBW2537281.1 peptidylprolyl isomerase [Deltaproteobacteria bacterium]